MSFNFYELPTPPRGVEEIVELDERLSDDGISFESLEPGQEYKYNSGNSDYLLKVVGFDKPKSGFLRYPQESPVVTLTVKFRDETLENMAGILLGVSLSGDGKLLTRYLPPSDSKFIACTIEPFQPADDQPEPDLTAIFVREQPN